MRGPMHMMTMNDTDDRPLSRLEDLIARHGALAIGLAYLRATLMRRHPPPDAGTAWLSDHILRDIGLPPHPPRWDREVRASERDRL